MNRRAKYIFLFALFSSIAAAMFVVGDSHHNLEFLIRVAQKNGSLRSQTTSAVTPKELQTGDRLFEPTEITAGASTKARLEAMDGRRIYLSSNTKIALTSSRDNASIIELMRLTQGRLDIRPPRKQARFWDRTPAPSRLVIKTVDGKIYTLDSRDAAISIQIDNGVSKTTKISGRVTTSTEASKNALVGDLNGATKVIPARPLPSSRTAAQITERQEGSTADAGPHVEQQLKAREPATRRPLRSISDVLTSTPPSRNQSPLPKIATVLATKPNPENKRDLQASDQSFKPTLLPPTIELISGDTSQVIKPDYQRICTFDSFSNPAVFSNSQISVHWPESYHSNEDAEPALRIRTRTRTNLVLKEETGTPTYLLSIDNPLTDRRVNDIGFGQIQFLIQPALINKKTGNNIYSPLVKSLKICSFGELSAGSYQFRLNSIAAVNRTKVASWFAWNNLELTAAKYVLDVKSLTEVQHLKPLLSHTPTFGFGPTRFNERRRAVHFIKDNVIVATLNDPETAQSDIETLRKLLGANIAFYGSGSDFFPLEESYAQRMQAIGEVLRSHNQILLLQGDRLIAISRQQAQIDPRLVRAHLQSARGYFLTRPQQVIPSGH